MDFVKGLRLTIFTAEDYKYEGNILFRQIVDRLYGASISGVTVVRGIMGYGSSKQMRQVRLADLFEGLPIIIDAVDTKETIEGFVVEHSELLIHCTVTTSPVELWR
ncbi:MAG: uncharacterized protein QG564_278 [Campylobacterota bacterium]|nr:uncharacterized protein [Campylobacterota bacterium]